MNRRSFSRLLINALAGLTGVTRFARASEVDQASTLSIGIVTEGSRPFFTKGAEMALEEATRAADLFKKRIRMTFHGTAGLPQGVDAIAASVSDERLTALAVACEKRNVVLLNCDARSDALRRKLCLSLTFHVEASAAMYEAAHRLAPDARKILLWDARLEKYGAAQLNDRFRAYAKRPMNQSAWAGWMAVKILWESYLRSPTSIRTAIAGAGSQFDGHKGAPLSFRAWDHQLRQPLYAITDRVVDVPDISRSTRPIRELLDTLGDARGVQGCTRPSPQ